MYILGISAFYHDSAACLVKDGEIISADSRQVYKRMDIGTGKDLNDYVVDDTRINYHLIDVLITVRFQLMSWTWLHFMINHS